MVIGMIRKILETRHKLQYMLTACMGNSERCPSKHCHWLHTVHLLVHSGTKCYRDACICKQCMKEPSHQMPNQHPLFSTRLIHLLVASFCQYFLRCIRSTVYHWNPYPHAWPHCPDSWNNFLTLAIQTSTTLGVTALAHFTDKCCDFSHWEIQPTNPYKIICTSHKGWGSFGLWDSHE